MAIIDAMTVTPPPGDYLALAARSDALHGYFAFQASSPILGRPPGRLFF